MGYRFLDDNNVIFVNRKFGRYEIYVNGDFYSTVENLCELQDELAEIEQHLAKKEVMDGGKV